MNYKLGSSLCLIVCLATLSGCVAPAVKVRGMTVSDVDAIKVQGVQPAIGLDVPMKKITKGKVAAARSVQVLAGLLGGGANMSFGPGNKEPADGYTVTEGHATVFSLDQVATLDGPADALAKALNAKLAAEGRLVSNQAPYSIVVKANYWDINYDKFSGEHDYRLYYSVHVDLMAGKELLKAYYCEGATEDKQGIDAWLANDEAAVKRDTAIIGDICADKALAAFELEPMGGSDATVAVESR